MRAAVGAQRARLNTSRLVCSGDPFASHVGCRWLAGAVRQHTMGPVFAWVACWQAPQRRSARSPGKMQLRSLKQVARFRALVHCRFVGRRRLARAVGDTQPPGGHALRRGATVPRECDMRTWFLSEHASEAGELGRGGLPGECGDERDRTTVRPEARRVKTAADVAAPWDYSRRQSRPRTCLHHNGRSDRRAGAS